MITNYIPNTCGYGLNNFKKVVHIFSESANVVHIDNGEAYVTSGITNFQTIKAASVSFEESVSYDDRFKFQKTVTATVNGFWKLSALGGKFYIVLEDENGVMWLVNADFPSLVTYTYTLQDGTDETVFTFNALSNFPTLKLNASVNNSYECKNYAISRVDELKMLEKRYANLNASSGIIYGYSNQVYKTVKFNEGSFKLEESFDGVDVNTTIQFGIDFDAYQSSWHYNVLEYPYNKCVVVTSNLACGFEMGLVPSYNVQGSHQIGGGDTVTVTLVGSSQRGSEWAESWMEVTVAPVYTWRLSDEWSCQPTEYRWFESGTTCVWCDKYNRVIKQYSVDGGETWNNVYPLTYSATTLVEEHSADCDCSKLVLTLSDYTTVSMECDSNSSITRSEVSSYTYSIKTAEVKECVTEIKKYVFSGCTGMTSVVLPNSLIKVGGEAFRFCENISSITLSDNVSQIGDYAFQSCTSLTAVTIGSGIIDIGVYAFNGCGNLQSITINRVTPPVLHGSQVFTNTNNCPIYVPAASVDTYKSTSGWSTYASRIFAIP